MVDVPEKEWFCFRCAHEREMDGCPIEQRVGNGVLGLSGDEVGCSMLLRLKNESTDLGLNRSTHTYRHSLL